VKILILIIALLLSGCNPTNEPVYTVVINAAEKVCTDINSTLYKFSFRLGYVRGEPVDADITVHCSNDYTKSIEVIFKEQSDG